MFYDSNQSSDLISPLKSHHSSGQFILRGLKPNSSMSGDVFGRVRWTLEFFWVPSTITQITKATSPCCFNTNKIFLHYCVIIQTRCWLGHPIRSSRLHYDHLVRNIYGVQIQFIERPEETDHFWYQRNGFWDRKCAGEVLTKICICTYLKTPNLAVDSFLIQEISISNLGQKLLIGQNVYEASVLTIFLER